MDHGCYSDGIPCWKAHIPTRVATQRPQKLSSAENHKGSDVSFYFGPPQDSRNAKRTTHAILGIGVVDPWSFYLAPAPHTANTYSRIQIMRMLGAVLRTRLPMIPQWVCLFIGWTRKMAVVPFGNHEKGALTQKKVMPKWTRVKIKIVPPVNIPIPTKIGSKWVVHQSPKMGSQNGFDPQPNVWPFIFIGLFGNRFVEAWSPSPGRARARSACRGRLGSISRGPAECCTGAGCYPKFGGKPGVCQNLEDSLLFPKFQGELGSWVFFFFFAKFEG